MPSTPRDPATRLWSRAGAPCPEPAPVIPGQTTIDDAAEPDDQALPLEEATS